MRHFVITVLSCIIHTKAHSTIVSQQEAVWTLQQPESNQTLTTGQFPFDMKEIA